MVTAAVQFIRGFLRRLITLTRIRDRRWSDVRAANEDDYSRAVRKLECKELIISSVDRASRSREFHRLLRGNKLTYCLAYIYINIHRYRSSRIYLDRSALISFGFRHRGRKYFRFFVKQQFQFRQCIGCVVVQSRCNSVQVLELYYCR